MSGLTRTIFNSNNFKHNTTRITMTFQKLYFPIKLLAYLDITEFLSSALTQKTIGLIKNYEKLIQHVVNLSKAMKNMEKKFSVRICNPNSLKTFINACTHVVN